MRRATDSCAGCPSARKPALRRRRLPLPQAKRENGESSPRFPAQGVTAEIPLTIPLPPIPRDESSGMSTGMGDPPPIGMSQGNHAVSWNHVGTDSLPALAGHAGASAGWKVAPRVCRNSGRSASQPRASPRQTRRPRPAIHGNPAFCGHAPATNWHARIL